MDDIVEEFLLEKLDKEIDGAREAEKKKPPTCNKLISIHEECQKLRDLIAGKKPATGAAVKETRREKLYYLLNLIEEWHELFNNQPRALLSVDQIPSKLKQVRKELEDAPDSHSEFKQPSSPEVYRWSCHAMSLAKTRGFEDKLMIMERLLLNKGSKAIGIVGVAGVGKTALSQQAYNYQPVQEHFLLRIWLCLSKQQKELMPAELSFEDRLKMMLSCLGFEDQVIQKVAEKKLLELAVRRHLSRGRYLIVLDDVWTVKDNGKDVAVEKEIQSLFSFLTAPHLSRYDGAIIVSSRSPELEQMVGAKNMHWLLPLADDESCWDICTDSIKEDGTHPPQNLEKLKGNIVKNCDGLPLMAKMLGKIAHHELKNPS
ncbi:probable disease resistance protein At4g19060 [Salvia miltiorrhiza]|uniref:probable disease resistance protein At4g19060 n=1 Tax=Salvia miltiorrhiza TaxID=226208 RepID=UPI0025AB7CA7|nr:probable disease resistance protein At4g19060 [Salvia miltiorrhiza]